MTARKDRTRTAPCGKVLQARGYPLHVKQCKQCAEAAPSEPGGSGSMSPADDSPEAAQPSTPPKGKPAERPAGKPFRFGLGFNRE